MIFFKLDVPDEFQARARYALKNLALRWGVPFQFGSSEGAVATVVYGTVDSKKSGRFFLKFDAQSYQPSAAFELNAENHWGRVGAEWDPVASTFRLLSLIDESSVEENQRDRKGRFLTTALSSERQKGKALPLVDIQAQYLWNLLGVQFPELPRRALPRWPSGKTWAVVLSHDTDALSTRHPTEILYNLVKGGLRRDREALAAAWNGLTQRGPVENNPLYGFTTWAELEEALGVRSCFYLFGNPPFGKREMNDCRTHVLNQKIDWEILKRMADRGFEFGLHAPIYAKQRADRFEWLKEAIEARLGREMPGVRHHYWALDWKKPTETYRMHQAAGFRYDSSLAWIDCPGFRAATSLPFAPFDLERNLAMDYTVIPAAIMDRQVLSEGNAELAYQQTFEFFQKQKAGGGLVVLNWHTEGAREVFGMKHYASVLKRVVAEACESSCWVATPDAVAQHWVTRNALLSRSPELSVQKSRPVSRPPELFA